MPRAKEIYSLQTGKYRYRSQRTSLQKYFSIIGCIGMITTNAKPIYFDSNRPEVKKFHSTGLFGRVSLGCSTTVKCFDEKECKHGYCSIQSDAERICKCDRGWTGRDMRGRTPWVCFTIRFQAEIAVSKSQNHNHTQLLIHVSQNHVVFMASVVHWKEALHANARKDGGKSLKLSIKSWQFVGIEPRTLCDSWVIHL